MKEKCCFLGCEEETNIVDSALYGKACSYHNDGGAFGNGETYEQYQIIEKDFIDFINLVPLAEEHYSVHSPFLRDIIIRTCVQIEIFFKEWAKSECSIDKNNLLFVKYSEEDKKTKKNKGEKNWTFKDYFYFKNENGYLNSSINVRVLNIDIFPFKDWTEKKVPFWWDAYNNIKHSGIDGKKYSTLKNALYSLSALFELHLSNPTSHVYLNSFNSLSIKSLDFGLNQNKLKLSYQYIQTPLDSRKYLFRSNQAFFTERNLEIPTQIGMSKALKTNKPRIN